MIIYYFYKIRGLISIVYMYINENLYIYCICVFLLYVWFEENKIIRNIFIGM